MGKRIKITGYLPVGDAEQEHIDLDHETGLTELGFDELLSHHGAGVPLKVADLEDVETEIEN